MFQHILLILLSALLHIWAYVGHVAHVRLSSNPQARWRVWPEGQLDTSNGRFAVDREFVDIAIDCW